MAIKNMGYTPQKASDMGLGKMIIHQWMEWGSPEILTQPMWYSHVATAHWPQFTTLDPDQSFWITTGEKTLVTWHFCKIQLMSMFCLGWILMDCLLIWTNFLFSLWYGAMFFVHVTIVSKLFDEFQGFPGCHVDMGVAKDPMNEKYYPWLDKLRHITWSTILYDGYIYLFIYLLFIYLSIYLSIHPSIYLSLYMYMYIYIYIYVYITGI